MTLLDGGSFQIGVSSTIAGGAAGSGIPIDQSLDDIIKSRAAAATKKTIPKAVSNVDRSIATARAKRDANVCARRGLSATPKATPIQIEQEVQKQANKTAVNALKKQQSNTTKNTPNSTKKLPPRERNAERQKQLDVLKKGRQAQNALKASGSATTSIIKLTLKQIKAAKAAMKEAGFVLPPNHSIQITVQSNSSATTTTKAKNPPAKSNNNNNNVNSNNTNKKNPPTNRRRNPNNTNKQQQ